MTDTNKPFRAVRISFDEIFERVHSGILYDKNLKPYSISLLEVMKDRFLAEESYEKCQILKSIIDCRSNHETGFIN